MTNTIQQEKIKEFQLLWGIAPKGTLKYKKGKDIESWLISILQEIKEKTREEIMQSNICTKPCGFCNVPKRAKKQLSSKEGEGNE